MQNFKTFLETPNENKELKINKKQKLITKPKLPRRHDEDDECKILADWLDTTGWLYTHIASESVTGHQGVLGRLKKIGVRKGCPDFIVLIPKKDNSYLQFWIEMKAGKNKTSPQQDEWIAQLNKCSECVAQVYYSGTDAIRSLNYIYNEIQKFKK